MGVGRQVHGDGGHRWVARIGKSEHGQTFAAGKAAQDGTGEDGADLAADGRRDFFVDRSRRAQEEDLLVLEIGDALQECQQVRIADEAGQQPVTGVEEERRIEDLETAACARSGTAGMQRFPICWSGDPNCEWEDMLNDLRAGLSIGLSGVPFWSCDTSG